MFISGWLVFLGFENFLTFAFRMRNDSSIFILGNIEMPLYNRRDPKGSKPCGILFQFFYICGKFVTLMFIEFIISIFSFWAVALVNNSLIRKPFYARIPSLSSRDRSVVICLVAQSITLDAQFFQCVA